MAFQRYTPADVAEIVEYAELLGIRVVVEVVTPGHTASWCASHPEVCVHPSCGSQSALSPATNATFSLIEDVLSDLSAVVLDNVMHLGGDEVQYACWNNSAAIRAWIEQQPWAAPYKASEPYTPTPTNPPTHPPTHPHTHVHTVLLN